MKPNFALKLSNDGVELLHRASGGWSPVGSVDFENDDVAEACAARARALGHKEDPELIFAPVLPWLEKEPALLVRMEYLLASARYAEAVNNRKRARALFRTADGLLQQIKQNEDPAVMSVHPWQRAVGKGLEI